MKTPKQNLFPGTFSILAISPDSNLMGVAVASGSTYVGERVPHTRPGIGVIATQAYTDVSYGRRGLKLLAEGLTPQEALNLLLTKDLQREMRQVAIMDFRRRKAVFTGNNVPEYHPELIGDDYIVIGNMLAREHVASSMAKEFENSSGDLALRMVMALKAGSQSDGDKRGEKSAALVIVGKQKVELEVKIDMSENPVEKLLQKLKLQ